MADRASKRQSLNGKVAVPLKTSTTSAHAAGPVSRFPNALELQKHIGYKYVPTISLFLCGLELVCGVEANNPTVLL